MMRRKAIQQFKGEQGPVSKKKEQKPDIMDEVNGLMLESEEPMVISPNDPEYINLCRDSVVAIDGLTESQQYSVSRPGYRLDTIDLDF